MLFIEFILQNKEKCTIAVNKIEGIYPHSDKECIIDAGADSKYCVAHSYDEVIMMLRNFDEVKWIAA